MGHEDGEIPTSVARSVAMGGRHLGSQEMPSRVKQEGRNKQPVWHVDHWRDQEVWHGQMKENLLFLEGGVDDTRGLM